MQDNKLKAQKHKKINTMKDKQCNTFQFRWKIAINTEVFLNKEHFKLLPNFGRFVFYSTEDNLGTLPCLKRLPNMLNTVLK